MEQIEILILSLTKTLNSLKKNPNHRYQKSTLITKLNASKVIYNEILEHCEVLEDYQQKFHLNSARFLYGEIKTFIDIRLERNHLLTFKTLVTVILALRKLYKKMAAPTVDLKLGTTLVPTYDGSPESLDSFVDAVLLFQDMVEKAFAQCTPAQKEAANGTVVRFVRTRLTGKARQSVNVNQNLNETLNAVKEHCVSKTTAENLIAKLSTVKQKDNVNTFCEQVEKITAQLKSVYIKDNIPEATANKMATKQGIEALIKGAKNHEAKVILKAGSFAHMNDAIQKFLENSDQSDTNEKQNVQIFYSTRGNSRGRGRFSQTRGNSNQRFQSNNRGYYHNSRGNFHGNRENYQSRGNFQGNRGNFSNRRGNWNQQGYYNNHQNMYMAQQVQNPQQQPLQQPMGQQQIQQPHLQQQLNTVGVHPLGVPFGQHTP